MFWLHSWVARRTRLETGSFRPNYQQVLSTAEKSAQLERLTVAEGEHYANASHAFERTKNRR